MSNNNKSEAKATFAPQSARFTWELTKLVSAYGIREGDRDDATKAVIGAMRRNIAERAVKQLTVQTKSGPKLKEVKEHEDKQRASGAALLKLRIGTTDEWFLGLCNKGVQALVRVDQALAGLEKVGAGVQWTPVPGSEIDTFIFDTLAAFKAREGYAKLDEEDAKFAATKAAEEAAMLLGK